jgi:hypothetical protein
MLGGLMLGATGGPAHPTHPLTVRLARGLSPASELRVLAHESSHVILGHAGMTYHEGLQIQQRREMRAALAADPLGGEDAAQEVAAELAAGAFCQVAGLGNGGSATFIGQKLAGRPVPEEARLAALLAARMLWAAASPALAAVS